MQALHCLCNLVVIGEKEEVRFGLHELNCLTYKAGGYIPQMTVGVAGAGPHILSWVQLLQ